MSSTPHSDTGSGKHYTGGYVATLILAAVLALFGIAILTGGVWLISLGGSWYYAFAGIGLCLTAWLLFRARVVAVWVYLATFGFTLIWALWEKGLEPWAQVPRLVAPAIVLLLVLATLPVLRKRDPSHGGGHGSGRIVAGLALGVIGVGIGALLVQNGANRPAFAQQAEAPAATVAEPEEEDAPAAPAAARNTDDGSETARTERAAESGGRPEQAEQLASAEPLEQPTSGSDWPFYGGTGNGTRYSPLDQITPENVGDLQQIWEYRWGEMPEGDQPWSPENTPLKIDDDLIACTPNHMLVSIDGRNGTEEWRYDPKVPDAALYVGACRGIAYFENPEAEEDDLCARRVLTATSDARLIAVDVDIGQPCPDFGQNGEVDLEDNLGDTVPGWTGATAPPTIVRGIAVIHRFVADNEAEDAPSGVVRGFDAVTGELAWAWDLGNPGDHDAPPEGEVYTRGTPNSWTAGVADEELGLVYLPLGNSAVDYYGSNRSELENEYATSIVAVDATTGEDVWHFQTVHRDVWDYDLGSQPALVDLPTADGSVPAIIVSSKQGQIYALNRETGEPLHEVEELPVPQGGVEPEYLSETQPFSAYNDLTQPPLEEADMWGMTPLDQLWCRILFRQSAYEGEYTPPTHDTWYIQYPGYNGGQDWGSMAVDEERGILVANYNDIPNRNRLITREEARERGMQPITSAGGAVGDPQIGAPYAIEIDIGFRLDFTGLMCKEPPYGGIRGIDVATGETLWDRPFGSARNNGPFGIPSRLPFTIGTPNNGGPIVTASGLIFIAATTDNLIHAIDIETGEELWSDVLPAGGQATPITYEVEGRQYIAMVAGGHGPMETEPGDYVWAWALPLEQTSDGGDSETSVGGSSP